MESLEKTFLLNKLRALCFSVCASVCLTVPLQVKGLVKVRICDEVEIQ